MKWFRVYDDIIDDPKILRLSPEFRWNYVGILCISSRQPERGTLPSLADIACHLRVTERKAGEIIKALVEAGLIDQGPGPNGLRVHGWDNRQFKSDNVTERWRKHKSMKGANVGQTLAPTEVKRTRVRTETDTESESPPPPVISIPEPSPAEAAILSRATERWGASSGDSVVSDLLRDYPAEWVKVACDAEWDKHGAALNVAYLRGILRGYHRQGGPPKPAKPSGRVEKVQPATNGADLPHTPRVYRDDKTIPASEAMAIFNAHLKRGTA